jgi:hypothetical protein
LAVEKLLQRFIVNKKIDRYAFRSNNSKREECMNSDKNLQFILSRIKEINVALFHWQTTTVLKIPTSIVRTYKVDDNGDLLFFLPRPKQLLSQFEKEFPVGLNYFKKGLNYYVNITGFARIVNDPEELYSYDLTFEEMEQALHKDVLVKVKILKADYYENEVAGTNSAANKIKSFFYSMLAWVGPNTKSFDFRTKPQMHNYGF